MKLMLTIMNNIREGIHSVYSVSKRKKYNEPAADVLQGVYKEMDRVDRAHRSGAKYKDNDGNSQFSLNLIAGTLATKCIN